MNYADFNTQPDGFPLESDATLGFVQSAYLDGIRAMAKITGADNIIVTGLIRTGNSVTEGWILKDGDLVFFEAGSYLDTYVISTDVEQKANTNGTLVDRYFTKKAMFGTGPSQFNFTDLRRVDNLQTQQTGASYIARGGFGATTWIILDGLEPNNGGVNGIESGRVLYQGRFAAIPPYALAVDQNNPVFLTPEMEWSTSDGVNY
ncbi:MAG: hypothetical protein D6772_01960, partial [Bacteroidetes bacterium]